MTRAELLLDVSMLGRPCSQGSHRWVVSRSTGRAVPKGAEASMAHRARLTVELRRAWGGRPAVDGPVHLSAVFAFPRPASHVGKRGRLLSRAPLLHTFKPDTDKLVRLVGDALTEAGVLVDDSRIVSLSAAKVWLPVEASGLTVVRVTSADSAALGDTAGGGV